jgi:hypothetical protein
MRKSDVLFLEDITQSRASLAPAGIGWMQHLQPTQN